MKSEEHMLAAKASPKEVLRLLHKYSLSDEIQQYDYGTAGFRLDARFLPGLMVRVGIIASLRSLQTQQHVGVMVTASHNDESYNGIKLADPDGGMLSTLQEQMAHQIANERDIPTLLRLIRTLLPINNGNGNTNHVVGVVHVGRDTRSHSPGLSELVVRTIVAMGLPVINHGILTTPMLHHCVLHANAHHYLPLYIPIRPHRKGYLDLLAYSYWSLIQTTTTSPNTFSSGPLVLDCACGVGYQAIIDLHHRLQSVSCGNARPLQARNAPGEGPLNVGCGSEVVQKNIQPPAWYGDMDIDVDSSSHSTKTSTTPTSTEVPYAASIDGDADRIVFFSTTSNASNSNSNFCMMDGDKIAVLICDFFQELLEQLYALDATLPQLTLGVVQTAYANGASTQYLKNRMGPSRVLIAKTGVKHVHAAAHSFDIGVYFEANGHGTVLFGTKVGDVLRLASPTTRSSPAWQRLRLLPCLVNPAVGDALSDLLLVDFILATKQWDIVKWNDNLYTDLPSRQVKVQVQDRSIIIPNHNETRCLQPPLLQTALDKAMTQVSGRCFVRPSGTENVVRIYAEATTRQDADWLAQESAKLAFQHCHGIGELPKIRSSKL